MKKKLGKLVGLKAEGVFMSERATGTVFGNTSCVGSVGTSAASTEWSAGKEASNAPGIMSVRISRGSIRRTVRGRLCEPA